MKKYNSTRYDDQRNWIAKARERNISWEEIYFGRGSSDDDLKKFVEEKCKDDFWEIDVNDWKSIVKLEKEGEDERKKLNSVQRSSVISSDYTINDIDGIPKGIHSCWMKYREHLLDDMNFLYDDVKAIETSSFHILKRLNSETEGRAIKGLVVGNVQSGKTANMAALMAMAADYGWNMFIILSGTIENLRSQTSNRLINDLALKGCNLAWQSIEKPARKQGSMQDKVRTLNFDRYSKNRYLTVCLKNSTRLKDLLQWLHEDEKSAANMKILVIDDESDQAGVNTKDVDSDERTKINELIVDLVSNKAYRGKKTELCFKAMNYIGYTATPYANVLNEASEDSLYPRDFIATLQVSKTYFGPQQIYGDRITGEYKGLDIIREIKPEEIDSIKDIHDGDLTINLKGLEEAICWFLCCAASFRCLEYKKPVSMLIHTSHITRHHDIMKDYINHWFKKPKDYILQRCCEIWEQETSQFTKSDLFEEYPDFAVEYEDVNDYLQYERIEAYLNELVDNGIQNIRLGDEGDMNYNKGVHLCVDNCRNNGVNEDGTYLRLAYPEKDSNPGYATAFIVIGGATLSRGLTIEGLVSTYFLRSTKQGDTLMQMGRWFGYRRGYELLQRIWITDNALRKFQFLADMDSELRECISQMEIFGKSPSDYAIAVKQSPANLMRISAKNKMQSAVNEKVNYSGMSSQTQLFIDDESVLKENFDTVRTFIESLGEGTNGIGDAGKHSYIWRDVSFDKIYKELLCKYKFHEKLVAFSNMDSLKEWIIKTTDKKKLKNWNVILFGLANGERNIKFSNTENGINKVRRTRKLLRDGTIDIGVLSDPKEKIADIDYNDLSEEGIKLYNAYKTENAGRIRKDAGLDKTPSLIIYIIDKDSRAKSGSSKRHDLNAPWDIAGLSLNIPGNRINSDYAESVKIDLAKYGLGNDIEGEEDEN